MMTRAATLKGLTALLAATAATTAAPVAAAPVWPVPSGAAVRIVLDRSGGFAGLRQSFVVDRSTAGGRRPLQLAGTSRFRHLRSSYRPRDTCCDRFLYRITVTYRGAHDKTIETVQGATAPSILWDVINLTERVGD